MSEILGFLDVNDYGLQSMVAGAGKMQDKTATPTTSQQIIEPDQGYDGMSSVTVNAVTSAIDENIIPTNIRSGKTILGVQGNLEPDKPDQNKTVTPSTVQQVVVADTGYELAQVTVEAVPDETPELNAQDTLLGNQETLIGQLGSALDDKIALDLQAATSDANATANDIAKDKTAYVNGVKLTGVAEPPEPDWTEIGYSDVPQDIIDDFNYSKNISDNWNNAQTDISNMFQNNSILKYMPVVDTSNVQNAIRLFNGSKVIIVPELNFNSLQTAGYMFAGVSNLSEVSLDLPNVTSGERMFQSCSGLKNIQKFKAPKLVNCEYLFYGCVSLISIDDIELRDCTNLNNMFQNCSSLTSIDFEDIDFSNVIVTNNTFTGCSSLVNIPQLNLPCLKNAGGMFANCSNLSNDSLNNILGMCISATTYSNTKTLSAIGISSTQATTCQTLSNWDAFVAAGWSSGY